MVIRVADLVACFGVELGNWAFNSKLLNQTSAGPCWARWAGDGHGGGGGHDGSQESRPAILRLSRAFLGGLAWEAVDSWAEGPKRITPSPWFVQTDLSPAFLLAAALAGCSWFAAARGRSLG